MNPLRPPTPAFAHFRLHSAGHRLLWMMLTCAAILLVCSDARGAEPSGNDVIQLRAWGVPGKFRFGPVPEADRQVIAAFRAKYPNIEPVSTAGLTIGT